MFVLNKSLNFTSDYSIQIPPTVPWSASFMALDYDGIWSSSIPKLSFLINGHVLGNCFRWCLSWTNPWISPLTIQYKYPQPFLLIIIRKNHPAFCSFQSFSLILCFLIQSHWRSPEISSTSKNAPLLQALYFIQSNFFFKNYFQKIIFFFLFKKKKDIFLSFNSPISSPFFLSNYERFNCNNIRINS